MQYRLFTIPSYDPDLELEELNRFLRSVKVFQVDRQFHADDRVWQMMVGYEEGKGSRSTTGRGHRKKNRIDYREILEPDQFVLFDRLRSWRKEQAGIENIPAYAIFTNEQLAAITRLKEFSLSSISTVDGIGEARLEKYGDLVLALCQGGIGEDGMN
ncbi:HRDC domain-containing protein [bacterium]|nr:HRDC domain-containing protein [bacterium]